jgi:hypothetical protein
MGAIEDIRKVKQDFLPRNCEHRATASCPEKGLTEFRTDMKDFRSEVRGEFLEN